MTAGDKIPNVKQAVSSQWEFPGHQKRGDKHYMRGNQAKTNKKVCLQYKLL